MRVLSAISIFLGSFLLFLVQPMVGNLVLPYFGGSAAVWVVCLCVFQTLLVLGYAYAHCLTGRGRAFAHVLLLIASAAALVPVTERALALTGSADLTSPVLPLVLFLLATVALPYVLIGANASFIQSLVATDRGGYRLYAISNAGSFTGLLSYPLLIEPLLSTGRQMALYSAGVVCYAVLLGCLLVRAKPSARARGRSPLLGSLRHASASGWFVLSAASCFLLDALTAHLTTDVAPLPLLWCVILAIYLATWIVAFTERGSRIGRLLAPAVVVLGVAAVCHLGVYDDYATELAICLALLFLGCWFIHARLYSLRPEVESLTGYYLVISLGGAVGGLLVAIVAPLVFPFVAEYPLALTLVFLLVSREIGGLLARFGYRVRPVWPVAGALVLGAVAFGRSQIVQGKLLAQYRNFHGTVRVAKCTGAELENPLIEEKILMYNNGTVHGSQMLKRGYRLHQATAYYTENGGGTCILRHPLRLAHRPIRAAFLGMGVGTLALYGEEGDLFRFFEINPVVPMIAKNTDYFDFVDSSQATVEIVVDDARKALERDTDRYDLIVVDVFSGDSIPPHMATKEAVALYLEHLTEEGILAFHISNWNLDLWPMVKSISRAFDLQCLGIEGAPSVFGALSYWAYLSRRPLPFGADDSNQTEVDFGSVRDLPPMTDDHHPLIRYIRH